MLQRRQPSSFNIVWEVIENKDPWNSNTYTSSRRSVNENKLGDSNKNGFKMGSSCNPDWLPFKRQKLSPICLNKKAGSGGYVIYSAQRGKGILKTLLLA